MTRTSKRSAGQSVTKYCKWDGAAGPLARMTRNLEARWPAGWSVRWLPGPGPGAGPHQDGEDLALRNSVIVTLFGAGPGRGGLVVSRWPLFAAYVGQIAKFLAWGGGRERSWMIGYVIANYLSTVFGDPLGMRRWGGFGVA
jgi:hypothetical protein